MVGETEALTEMIGRERNKAEAEVDAPPVVGGETERQGLPVREFLNCLV